jgi:hypothetical protein
MKNTKLKDINYKLPKSPPSGGFGGLIYEFIRNK